MLRYAPFDPARLARLSELLAHPPASLDELRGLRARLSGEELPLDGLRALFSAEPGLERAFLARTLPALLGYARALLDTGAAHLEVHSQAPARTVMARTAVAGWIAHMFLGTLPPPSSIHPGVDIGPLLVQDAPWELAKLRCILGYFSRIAASPPRGSLEVERIAVASRTAEAWAADRAPLLGLEVISSGAIEDAEGHRQVDFANMYLGGGVLSGGCVQEEIRFSVAPELLVGLVLSPRMADGEAIVLRGSERFSTTKGYAGTLRYAGELSDPCPRFDDGTPDVELVALDAIDYRQRSAPGQLSEGAILRELDKARAGYSRDGRQLPVATGNWGCGVFGGDPPLKAIVQWLAASTEGRALRYYSFADPRVGELSRFASAARRRLATVGALFARVLETRGDAGGIYERVLGPSARA